MFADEGERRIAISAETLLREQIIGVYDACCSEHPNESRREQHRTSLQDKVVSGKAECSKERRRVKEPVKYNFAAAKIDSHQKVDPIRNQGKCTQCITSEDASRKRMRDQMIRKESHAKRKDT